MSDSTGAAVLLGDRLGRRDRSVSGSPARLRFNQVYPVCRLIPNRSHKSERFIPACLANATNSSRCDMIDLACQGMTGLLPRGLHPQLYLSTMSPNAVRDVPGLYTPASSSSTHSGRRASSHWSVCVKPSRPPRPETHGLQSMGL
jgi:hypothetical protein